ncbi:MAG: MraY family glycosyltransferase [Pseudomonadota bacterium]
MSETLLLAEITVALAVTVGFMFALRPVAKSVRLIDRPGGRKSHVGVVPVIGGLAMFGGLFAGLSLAGAEIQTLPSLSVAAMLLVGIGVIDDKYPVPAGVRMLIQLAAILIMAYGAGLSLQTLGDPFGIGPVNLGPAALIMTILVTLTVVNAYNLIDGVDGLAGSLALIALLSLALVGGIGSPSTTIALNLFAAVVGFLVFNFPTPWNRRVRAFMGDAGSTFLGFMIVWVTLGISQGPEAAISPVYCLWFAAVPIFDLFTCVVRRSLARKSPFRPGRDHFHHTLKRGGMGVRLVLATLTGIQLIYAGVGLLGYYAGIPEPLMFTAWLLLASTQRLLICTIRKQHRMWLMRRRREQPESATTGI